MTGDTIKTILLLRNDAIERGLSEAAIAYGWSAIRLGEEELKRQMSEIERYRLCK